MSTCSDYAALRRSLSEQTNAAMRHIPPSGIVAVTWTLVTCVALRGQRGKTPIESNPICPREFENSTKNLKAAKPRPQELERNSYITIQKRRSQERTYDTHYWNLENAFNGKMLGKPIC